jgi:catalase
MQSNEKEEGMTPRAKRAVLGLVVVFALVCYVFWPSPPGPMGEVISANEQYLTAQIVASGLHMVDLSQHYMTAHPLKGYPPKTAAPAPAIQSASRDSANAQAYRRDVHAKMHGCVKATFTVLGNLDSRLRHGLFATPAQYHAWIRFSSGNEYPQKDSARDARGMAVKLMGVKGRKLLEDDGAPPAGTQDFVMMNATQFFIRNIEEYTDFVKYLGSGLDARARYGYFLGGFPIPHPSQWHPREMYLAMKTLKAAPDSVLNVQYYSVSAYKLGPQENVKYTAKPCSEVDAARVDRSTPNFLREEMKQRLSGGSACFDFMVQFQVPGKNMPVEDTTVKWSESDSPFIPVARIEIPAQQFEANTELGENLSFNPWHSLPDHRPIGVMNRIRKAVYLGISRYRRDMNGVPLCEPSDWDKIDEASCETRPEPVKTAETASPEK